MHLLLLNQFYPPDVAPTGQYLHDVARELVARGHTVTVLCSRRAYDGGQSWAPYELLDGVHIHRLAASGFGRRTFAGKVLDYLSFSSNLALALTRLRPRPDSILALTTPPFLGLLAHRHRIPHAHWIMDLYPDVLAAHGALRTASLPYRLLQRLARLQFRGSSLVFTISPDMAARTAAYVSSANVPWVPLWSTIDTASPPAPARIAARRLTRGWAHDDVVLMYSGNMGLGHRFDEFLEVARRLHAHPRLRWVFAGGGKRIADIRAFAAQHPDLRLEILPYAPPAELAEHLASADVHLASLDSRWQGGIVPSKLQNAFAVGRPVIFVGATTSGMAHWIEDAQGGWVVKENDIAALEAAVTAAANSTERLRRGEAAQRYARTHFNHATNGGRICALIEEHARHQP
jgi:glycosyltransferase involved in cell wall biosynthesis